MSTQELTSPIAARAEWSLSFGLKFCAANLALVHSVLFDVPSPSANLRGSLAICKRSRV